MTGIVTRSRPLSSRCRPSGQAIDLGWVAVGPDEWRARRDEAAERRHDVQQAVTAGSDLNETVDAQEVRTPDPLATITAGVGLASPLAIGVVAVEQTSRVVADELDQGGHA